MELDGDQSRKRAKRIAEESSSESPEFEAADATRAYRGRGGAAAADLGVELLGLRRCLARLLPHASAPAVRAALAEAQAAISLALGPRPAIAAPTSALSLSLEQLPAELLEAVLQQLGPAEATCVRAVSRRMREAYDRVAWQSLRLEMGSASQIKERTTPFAQRRIRLATGCTVDLVLQTKGTDNARAWRHAAVASLLSACSASSGGLGGVSMINAAECCRPWRARGDYDMIHGSLTADELVSLITAVLGPLSSPAAGGGSSHTLKSFVIDLAHHSASIPHDLLDLVACFPRLERLELPNFSLPSPATHMSALSAALPALRSVVFELSDSPALTAFVAHSALEELEISKFTCEYGAGAAQFQGFSALAADARHLRKLRVAFSTWRNSGFHVAELPSLSRLTTLEALKLQASFHVPDEEGIAAGEAVPGLAIMLEQALGGLGKLRELDLNLSISGRQLGPAYLRGLGLALHALFARLPVVSLQLDLDAGLNWTLVGSALVELLRTVGPVLVKLRITDRFAHGGPFAALATCPRLQQLELSGWSSGSEPPIAAKDAVNVLAACPRLEEIRGLPIAFSSAREAAALVEPLRRLASASRLGSGAQCAFKLWASTKRGEGLGAAKKSILSVFPKSECVKPQF